MSSAPYTLSQLSFDRGLRICRVTKLLCTNNLSAYSLSLSLSLSVSVKECLAGGHSRVIHYAESIQSEGVTEIVMEIR